MLNNKIYKIIKDANKLEGSGLYEIISKIGNIISKFRKDSRRGLVVPAIGVNNYCGPGNDISMEYQRDYPPSKEPFLNEKENKGACVIHDILYDEAINKKKELESSGKMDEAKIIYNKLINEADTKLIDFLDNYNTKNMSETILKPIVRNAISAKRWIDTKFGAGLDYKLHAVIINNSIPIKEAIKISQDFIKNKNKKFFRITTNNYRFRNIPKTKFIKKSFRTKKINEDVSLIYGKLK